MKHSCLNLVPDHMTISICFVLSWKIGLAAICFADWLSQYIIIIGEEWGTKKSCRRYNNHCPPQVSCANVLYSASEDDMVTLIASIWATFLFIVPLDPFSGIGNLPMMASRKTRFTVLLMVVITFLSLIASVSDINRFFVGGVSSLEGECFLFANSLRREDLWWESLYFFLPSLW